MSARAPFALRGRNPDILTCIANLTNDEVFTPPELANRMLDMVAEAWAANNDGASIWADPSVRFLDPCTKSGVFLREITSRLTKGLRDRPSLDSNASNAYNACVAINTGSRDMPSLTIRNVDDLTKQKLRIRAATRGVSMEEEARRILKEALARSGMPNKMGRRLLDRFAGLSSDEFALPGRHVPRDAPQWEEPE